MKTVLLAALLMIPGLAKADFTCKKGNYPPDTQISYSSATHLYFVSVNGYRVNFAAQYKAVQVASLPDGEQVVSLLKVSDQSTYSNMPLHLEFKVDATSAKLSGLQIYAPSPETVTFSNSECAQ
jgi:hypothetical protein